MIQLKLFINKTIEQNAALYFEKAKKSKKKLQGALRALETTKIKLLQQEKSKVKTPVIKATRTKKWYDSFRWFVSSEGFLCVGGRDATTNEILIKKHTESNDIVFHTKIEGSPFFVIKAEGKKPGKASLEETAQATASYSRAWRLGLSGVEVFYVTPDQLSKQAPTGEYIGKGAFTISGKMNLMFAAVQIAVGITKDQIIGGPVNAIKKNADKYTLLKQGKGKTTAIGKKIQRQIGGDLDEIIRFIPAGGADLL
ncbi:MAG: NFACT RNA binding domain-containing protein [Candidatus Woesearchaeota archaeon]